jgi:ribosomal protein S18 acetylase RimI-like enzyme
VSDQTPLTQAKEAELAGAVQENLFALFRAMSRLPGGELEEGAGFSRHHAFPTNPVFKGVWQTQLAPDDADAAIAETIAWFQARHAPFFFWWTGPGTEPTDLGRRLVAHGLLSYEAQEAEFAPGIHSSNVGAPGLIADLHAMHEASLTQVPAGFTIEEVQTETDLDDFKTVLIAGYEMPEIAAQGWVDAALAVGIGNTPWRMYLGRLEGKPVATNMLLNGAGVASVYGVATVPEARGRGIGGAITLKPLLDARAEGYRYAVLFASEMGIHAYERIGFRLCPTRINRFLWRAG